MTLIFCICLLGVIGNKQHHKKQESKLAYKATYYADKFEGRQTATGDIFTNEGLTVATSNKKFYKN